MRKRYFRVLISAIIIFLLPSLLILASQSQADAKQPAKAGHGDKTKKPANSKGPVPGVNLEKVEKDAKAKQGQNKVKVRIVELGKFYIIGKAVKARVDDEKSQAEIDKLWDKVDNAGLLDKIPNRKNPNVVLGVQTDYNEKDDTYTYIVACEVTSIKNPPKGMVSKEIPKAKYAVFTGKGKMPDIVDTTWDYINDIWLPQSEWEEADSPEFEWYDYRSDLEQNAEMDIYIPIE